VREVLIIIKREFMERVRSRAFLLGTILFPLFMIALFALPILMERGTTAERHFALIDEAPDPIGERFETAITATRPSGNIYTVERVPGPYDAVRDQLIERVRSEDLDGYLVLTPTIVDDNVLIYRARSVGNENVLGDIRAAASEAVQAERLRLAGLEGVDVVALTRRINVDDAAITETGEEGRGALGTFIFAYVIAILIYMITALYGQGVLRSVLEEKTNRIAEVLVSSVKASNLMMGKIVGVGAAAMLQVAIWVVAIIIIATRSDLIARRIGIPPEAFSALSIPLGQGILFVTYFVLGFLLFASLFAAVGAAITSEQEAQSVAVPVMVPLFLPLILSFQITAEPTSTMATVLGLVPLTSPMTMPMRISAAPIPAIQVAASLVFLVIGLWIMAWIGGKVFRIGILSTGKRPSFRELLLWLREA
jgi:ABC-2 type transport system permease protein